PLVIWDDHCSFCRNAVRFLRFLDWGGRLDYLGSSDTVALARLGISPEEADRELKLVYRDVRFGGYDAIAYLTRFLPLTFLFSPLFGLSPVRLLGRRVYRSIAARRKCTYLPPPPLH
ncbi:MAG: DUF393 domain-containing protein, partial [Bryobacteraceae bacterium]|nr:DUF393 domain-containing protein [Bryobacteraceae bacterium]